MEVKRDEITDEQYDEMKRVSRPFAASSLTEQSKADLFRGLYWYFQLSRRDIGELLCISPGLVSHYMQKYKIPARPRAQALSLAFKQGKIRRHYGKGKDHFNWRGGRILSTEGYVLVMRPDHPRANSYGYVREHILVWEQTHGMPLPKGWIVHHLNGIHSDNRPENLIALPNRKHKMILAAKGERIKELESKLLKAQKEIESFRQAMIAGQLTFNLDGHEEEKLGDAYL